MCGEMGCDIDRVEVMRSCAAGRGVECLPIWAGIHGSDEQRVFLFTVDTHMQSCFTDSGTVTTMYEISKCQACFIIHISHVRHCTLKITYEIE